MWCTAFWTFFFESMLRDVFVFFFCSLPKKYNFLTYAVSDSRCYVRLANAASGASYLLVTVDAVLFSPSPLGYFHPQFWLCGGPVLFWLVFSDVLGELTHWSTRLAWAKYKRDTYVTRLSKNICRKFCMTPLMQLSIKYIATQWKIEILRKSHVCIINILDNYTEL